MRRANVKREVRDTLCIYRSNEGPELEVTCLKWPPREFGCGTSGEDVAKFWIMRAADVTHLVEMATGHTEKLLPVGGLRTLG